MAKRKSSVRTVRSERMTLRLPLPLWKYWHARAHAEGLPVNFLVVAVLKDAALAARIPQWPR